MTNSADAHSDAEIQAAVKATYVSLADLLDGAPTTAWDTQSLCERWRVREVVAHVTMPAHYDEAAFMRELQARDFDFGRLSNEIAERDAQRPTDELLAGLRSAQLHDWVPPQGGAHGALNHAVIHSLDVTIPLGAPRCAGDDAMKVVLDDLTRGDVHAHFGINVEGRRFEATDLGWSYGEGAPLRATAADLAVVLCGRHVPADRIDGEPL